MKIEEMGNFFTMKQITVKTDISRISEANMKLVSFLCSPKPHSKHRYTANTNDPKCHITLGNSIWAYTAYVRGFSIPLAFIGFKDLPKIAKGQ